MKKYLLSCLLCFFTLVPFYGQRVLFPTPSSYTQDKGNCNIGRLANVSGTGNEASQLAESLKAELQHLPLSATEGGTIQFVLDEKNGLSEEAYQLTVTAEKVLLEASTVAGLFHAKEALLQMLRFGKGSLQCCRIQNHPRYAWRGFMLDESRHFFGKEKVKQYLDLMASLHLNVFHWHLTDEPGWRIEIKRFPKLTQEGAIGNWHDPKAPAAFYTQEDIKEIVAYAAERQIMVVPEFDMPGHATAVCRAYPEVSGGGEGRWAHFTFHPCKEETYTFISQIFDELFTLFPSPYIHIGGDEVHYGNQSWFTDPKIQQFIQDKQLGNETGLEHYFIRRIADIVASKGKTIIAWDEAIDAGVSPDKLIVMWWRHDRKHQLVKALENGYRVIMTPRRPFYGDFIQYGSHKVGRFWNGYNPIEDLSLIHISEPTRPY